MSDRSNEFVMKFGTWQSERRSVDELLNELRRQGTSCLEAVKVLMRLYHLDLGAANRLIETHPVWRDDHGIASLGPLLESDALAHPEERSKFMVAVVDPALGPGSLTSSFYDDEDLATADAAKKRSAGLWVGLWARIE